MAVQKQNLKDDRAGSISREPEEIGVKNPGQAPSLKDPAFKKQHRRDDRSIAAVSDKPKRGESREQGKKKKAMKRSIANLIIQLKDEHDPGAKESKSNRSNFEEVGDGASNTLRVTTKKSKRDRPGN